MLRYAEQIISAVITIGLFIGWLGLIVRRHHMLGPAAPLEDRQWFLDIFRRGWENILRCRWLLWLPLLMVVIASAESKVSTAFSLKRRPELQRQLDEIQRENLVEFLKGTYHFLPSDLFSAAGQLTEAMFSPLFRSFTVMALFLLAVMVILLNPQRPDMERADKVIVKRKKLLAILSGTFGIILSFSTVWVIRSQWQKPMEWTWSWLYLPVFVLSIFGYAFGFTTFFHAIDAAEEGKKESFSIAVHKGIAYFQPVLLFLLIITGIGLIADLPMYGSLFVSGEGYTMGHIQQYFDRIRTIFFFMISFVPLLIVIQRITIVPAFDRCITLWARNWKNLLALSFLGTLLLLVPVILEGRLPRLLGWELAGAGGLLIMAVKTGLGAWILSTFVVFLRKVEE